MSYAAWRNYGTGMWRLAIRTGLAGVMYPGLDGAKVESFVGTAGADAVVDDFGDLVVVGFFR